VIPELRIDVENLFFADSQNYFTKNCHILQTRADLKSFYGSGG